MIILQPLSENTVVLSLSEKVTISSPTYLMRFLHRETQNNYTCIITPEDLYEFGRQSFVIETVDSGADNLLGQIVLTYGGEYDYYAYAQSSTTNLDWTLANEQLEEGIMIYDRTITPRTEYERAADTRKVWNG